jgi:SAM-dependent methyltransferase
MSTLGDLNRATTFPLDDRAPVKSRSLAPPAAVLDAGFRPLRGVAWWKRFQAWALSLRSPRYDGLVAARKLALFSPLEGTVLEIGPGAGANLPFFRTDVRWIGVEPNPFLHPTLEETATRLGRDIELRAGTAEQLPVPSQSVDAVVGTLVLCSVHDPAAALREVLRVLRPGGRFVFMEHVAAPRGSVRRFVQRLLRPFWTFAADGCHLDRDTAATIRAAGFRAVMADHFDLPIGVIGPHVAGTAWAP